jgi:hypothetical protein
MKITCAEQTFATVISLKDYAHGKDYHQPDQYRDYSGTSESV